MYEHDDKKLSVEEASAVKRYEAWAEIDAMQTLFGKLDEGITDMEAGRTLCHDDAMKMLFAKLDEGINDMEAGRVQTLEEAWVEINAI